MRTTFPEAESKYQQFEPISSFGRRVHQVHQIGASEHRCIVPPMVMNGMQLGIHPNMIRHDMASPLLLQLTNVGPAFVSPEIHNFAVFPAVPPIVPASPHQMNDRYTPLSHHFPLSRKSQSRLETLVIPRTNVTNKDSSGKDQAMYPCSVCSHKFRFKADRDRHMRRHTGERPFACDLCPLRFSRKDVLLCHRRTHSKTDNPYVCEICGRKFRFLRYLKSHKKRNHCISKK